MIQNQYEKQDIIGYKVKVQKYKKKNLQDNPHIYHIASTCSQKCGSSTGGRLHSLNSEPKI